MEMIKATCEKIKQSKTIPGFNGLHTRALLCFTKYKKLNLYELVTLMDTRKSDVLKTLEDLIKLEVIRYNPPHFIMEDPFLALYTLINNVEKGN